MNHAPFATQRPHAGTSLVSCPACSDSGLGTRLGRALPWTMTTSAEIRENFQRLERLGWFAPGRARKRMPLDSSGSTQPAQCAQAAVLFLIGLVEREPYVLLTKRSNTVTSHIGETCLPGGRREKEDASLVETALREAEEEVGLDRQLVALVAVLPPFPSGWATTTAVTPVVCSLGLDPRDLQLQPNSEVDHIFWVPLRVFLDGKSSRVVKGFWRGMLYTHPSFCHTSPTGATHTIWGLTGSICVVASSIALDRCPDFPVSVFLIYDIEGPTLVAAEILWTTRELKEYGTLPAKL